MPNNRWMGFSNHEINLLAAALAPVDVIPVSPAFDNLVAELQQEQRRRLALSTGAERKNTRAQALAALERCRMNQHGFELEPDLNLILEFIKQI